MQDLNILLSIDNKEVFTEILNHSIDYLIGNHDDETTMHLCYKLGFTSPDDFMLATKQLAKYYRNCCHNNEESKTSAEFANFNEDFQKLVPMVYKARKQEILRYLMRRHNAQDNKLVESFDWDLRFIMGDSSFAQNRRQIATVTLNCNDKDNKRSVLHFEMDRKKLTDFIEVLEEAVTDLENKSIEK